jgi:dTDP-4-dehydrorhamnose reductase
MSYILFCQEREKEDPKMVNPIQVLSQEAAESMAQVVAEVLGSPVTRGELNEAFKKVEPKPHWKAPINAIVHVANERELFMIHEAIVFFCGCKAAATFVEPAKYRFEAPGYWAAVGA